MPTTWWELTLQLERAIDERLKEYTKDLWKEDAISIDVAKATRKVLAGAKVDVDHEKAAVVAEIFKADGTLEETFGDLALVVEATYRDGQKLKGVAFYEAKKRDWASANLSAMKRSQLVAMHNKLWNGNLLVYDPEPQTSRLAGIVFAPWWRDRHSYPPSVAPVTRALSIPLGPVLQCDKPNATNLYKFGTPFSSQIVLRNLQGLDLDHDQIVVEAATGYSQRMSVPKLVLAIGIRFGKGEAEVPSVNNDRLSRVVQD